MNINYYLEMALARPIDKLKTYYHGTSGENGEKIIKEGIKAPEIVGKTRLSPVKGKQYITTDLGYAIIYAIRGDIFGTSYKNNSNDFGYVFEIPGKNIEDIRPDEDSVGEIIYNELKSKKRNDKLIWLIHLYSYNATQNQKKNLENGEFDAFAQVGKKILKLMTDEQKLLLIDIGNSHIAHESSKNLMPTIAYKIYYKDIQYLKNDGSNFFKYAEKITL